MMKKILAGVALTSLSVAAFAATLTIDNNSDGYSTALVNGQCQGSFQIFTPPGKTNDQIQWYIVQSLCGSTTGTCTADVYVFPTASCTDLSQGVKVAQAQLDLASGAITPPTASNGGYTMTVPTNYKIVFSGTKMSTAK
jgi:hypothetical protein